MKWESYEISLWSHQEAFLATLCNSQNFRKYDANSPVLNCSTTGQSSLTFSIPIVCYNLETGQLENNTLWYNDLVQSQNLANEKRVKLIFDKTLPTQRILEFVITTMEQSRNGEELYCNVTCSGLAFKWLGKIGFDITLDSETMLLEQEENDNTLIPTINYWLDKIFPRDEQGNWMTFWRYRIDMTYVGYIGNRQSDKVYEDDDIVNWHENPDGSLTSEYNTEPIEKSRFISVEESNKYNITQDIAEEFEVFARYEFLYEDHNNPYKATAGVVVFYNQQVQDTEYVISYRNNQVGLIKTSESSDIVTKMYVDPVADEYSDNGFVSLSQADANKMGEEYLFNFDYYIASGEMTAVQQKAIADYELDIRHLNQQIEQIVAHRDDFYNQIIDGEAEMNNAKDSMTSSQELVTEYNNKLATIAAQMTQDISDIEEKVMLLVRTDDFGYYVALTRMGIKPGTIVSNTSGITSSSWTTEQDQFGYITKLKFGSNPDVTTLSLTYRYDMLGYYNQIIAYYEGLANSAESVYHLRQNNLGHKEDLPNQNGLIYAKYNYWADRYKQVAAEKEQRMLQFEELMGYFIKEGKWDANDFSVSYENKTISSPTYWNNGYNAEGFFPTAKESEVKSYYELGIQKTPVYYDYVELDNNVINGIEDYSTFTLLETWNDGQTDRTNYYTNGAHGSLQFLKIADGSHYWIIPVFLFNNSDRQFKSGHNLAYRYSNDSGTHNISNSKYHRVASEAYANDVNINPTIDLNDDTGAIHHCSAAGEVVYRRIAIDDSNVSDTSVVVTRRDGVELDEFDTYLFYKIEGIKTVTFKIGNQFPMNLDTTVLPLTVHYKQDHSSQQLYYDAKDVLKTSAFPEVTYQVEFAYLNKANKIPHYGEADYNDSIDLNLGCIVRINDWQLGLKNVKGIVSEFTLDLDSPQNTQFTISNYKTRFEDLFGRIVAQTEAMQSRAASYERAASAVTPTGEIVASLLQQTITNNSLIFSSGYNSAITWDENGIVVENTLAYANGVKGQVVIKGGGILLSNALDADGNRLYTSAITPNGINATALTVGRLNTEKINIYSGDQIRFMWNGEGLFAYADDKVDDIQGYITSYICYNQDGLIFYENSRPTVSLSWNGLYIGAQDGSVELDGTNGLTMYNGPKYDHNGEEVEDRITLLHIGRYSDNSRAIYYGFRLFDYEGNPTLITDNTGALWLKDKLQVGNGRSMSGISAEGTTQYDEQGAVLESPVRFWAGDSYNNRTLAPFWVLEDGTIHATKAYIEGQIHATSGEFSGTITADSGTIGGWTIENNKLVASPSAPATIEFTDANGKKSSLGSGGVNITGEIHATSGEFTGTINASGGKIGNLSIYDLNQSAGIYYSSISSSYGTTTTNSEPLITTLTTKVQNGVILQNGSDYSYQWQVSDDGEAWTKLTSQTTQSITVELIVTTNKYIRSIATKNVTNADSTAELIQVVSDILHFINITTEQNIGAEFTETPKNIFKFYSNMYASGCEYSPVNVVYSCAASNVTFCMIAELTDIGNRKYYYINSTNVRQLVLNLNEVFDTSNQISSIVVYIIKDNIPNTINRLVWSTSTTIANILASADTYVYDKDVTQVEYGSTKNLARFAVNAASITAAVSDAGFNFDSDGLSIDGGALTILNQGNVIFKVNEDTGDIYVKGLIEALTGSIGAWQIDSHGLISNSAGIYADDGVKVDNKSVRFWSGKDGSDYNFYVTSGGQLYCSNVDISGTVNVTSGNIMNALTVGNDHGIIIYGGDESHDSYISTAQFSSGALGYGWRLMENGSATFTDAYVRGKITSAVFEYNGISSVGGSLYIAPTIYTVYDSDKIQYTSGYNMVSWRMEQSLNNFNGHTWKVGDGLKIDGNINVNGEYIHLSDISAQITSTANQVLTVKFQHNSTSYKDAIFTKGTAIIFYNDNEKIENKYGLYLTASDENGPFMDVYDSAHITSPAARIGNLSGVVDSDFGGRLQGYGLYTSNAYLRGQLRLPNAGITNQTVLFGDDNSPIRIWAGLPANTTDITQAYFIVTQDGSLYAEKGVFKGTVIADNSEFSGTIKAAGIVIDNTLTDAAEADSDHFFVAYDSNPTSFDQYVLNIGNDGLSIWQGGFRIFSDADSSNGIYGYSNINLNPWPYVSVADEMRDGELESRLITTKLHITKTDYDSSTLKYSTNSIVLDSGIWFNIFDTYSTKKTETAIYFENKKNVGLFYDNKLNIKSNEILLDAVTRVNVHGELSINNENLSNQISLGQGVIKERKQNNVCLGFDFIVG